MRGNLNVISVKVCICSDIELSDDMHVVTADQ